MPTIHLHLTDEEHGRLSRLAAHRSRTPEQCLRDLIIRCFPEGDAWKHPSEGKSTIAAAPELAHSQKPDRSSP